MNTEERTALAERARLARKRLKLTQQEVADKAGVSLGVIGNLENGKTVPQGANRRAIAQALAEDVFGDNIAQSTRDLWPGDVQVFTDVLGQYLASLDPDARARQVSQWMSDIMLGHGPTPTGSPDRSGE